MKRTHNCSELKKTNVGEEVVLQGWVNSIRNHGGITFVNLRDRSGITQTVIPESLADIVKDVRREFVLEVIGIVDSRKDGMENKNMSTGEIEVTAKNVNIIAKCDVLPMDMDDGAEVSDETRLKYRYLDLRKPTMKNNIIFRSKVMQSMREFLLNKDFLELETPLLVKSTPEGARDYVVPSRVNKGKFYALPQSPQLYKQLLMVSGFEKYFQFARCLRDEDLRADRQPEHTQLDLEMSFVDGESVRSLIEDMIKFVFKKTKNVELEDFKVLSYNTAMETYGSDKPDLRFGLELTTVSDVVKTSSFNVFSQAEYVNCLFVDKDFSRKEIDKLTDVAKRHGAKGLAWMKYSESFDGGITKFIEEPIQKALIEKLNISSPGTLLFVADKKRVAQNALGNVRLAIADKLELKDPNVFKFSWITDFPLFHFVEEENRWEPEHHMFSMPKQEFVENFEKNPGETLGDLWDLALNGMEMASGSIRISNPEIQKRIMNFVGFPEEEAKEKFGFLLDAYKYGCPSHGGIGLGIARLVSMMLGVDDIREVIIFPKNKNAQCPMDESPGFIDEAQLDELGIKIKKD